MPLFSDHRAGFAAFGPMSRVNENKAIIGQNNAIMKQTQIITTIVKLDDYWPTIKHNVCNVHIY